MKKRHFLPEALESRIAPALLDPANLVAAVTNSSILLHVGDLLSTSSTGGAYLMYVQKGDALVFTTDLNKNGLVDPNEITGIAAGNGLQMISFVNINGD